MSYKLQKNAYPESAQDWVNSVSSNDEQPSLINELSSSNQSLPLSKEDKQDIARGALQGGKSGIAGALIGGGTAAGIGAIGAEAGSAAAAAGPWGWGAVGAGLLLSELQSQSEAEAMQEQANIQAEVTRRQNAQKAGNSLLAMYNSFGSMKV